jgi:ATP-dependent Lon protease
MHQIQNFVRLCETIVREATIRQICLVTAFESQEQQREVEDKLADLKQSLLELDVQFDLTVNNNLHDREIRIDNGWTVKIGRGLDIYQKPDNWTSIGAFDLSQRKCMETKVDVFRSGL